MAPGWGGRGARGAGGAMSSRGSTTAAIALGMEEAGDRGDRAQVPFRDLVLFQRAAELPLQKPDQLDHADRIDHAAPEEWIVVLQRPVGTHVEEGFTHVGSRAVRDHRPRELSRFGAHRPHLTVARQAAAGASAAAGPPGGGPPPRARGGRGGGGGGRGPRKPRGPN